MSNNSLSQTKKNNPKYSDRNLNSVTQAPPTNLVASQQGTLHVLNPGGNRLSAKNPPVSIGVSAAPTPVNTSSLRSEKGKDTTSNLVPVVWTHTSGANDPPNESQSADADRASQRPAPWSGKSQTDNDTAEVPPNPTSQTAKEVQNKRRSWADSDDDDDDDDPPEKPTPAPYAVSAPVVEHSRAPSHSQDVRYLGEKDGRADHRPSTTRSFVRDNHPSNSNWQQPPPEREFNKSRYEPNNFRGGRGSERDYDNRYPHNRFEQGRGHPSNSHASPRPHLGQGNGYANTNDWSSGSGNRGPHSGADKVPEEQRALELARFEREQLEKKKQEEALRREVEREAEKERIRVEEEKRQQAAVADLQLRQQSIQQVADVRWERAKLPPPLPSPVAKPTQPRSPYAQDNHIQSFPPENDGRKGGAGFHHASYEPSDDTQHRKILQHPKHLYDPKSSSMVEPSPIQKGPQRFDRGYGDDGQERKFHRPFDLDPSRAPSDDHLDEYRKRDPKRFNHTPMFPPEDLKMKAEAREARDKEKLERPPRTAGVLYRYDENGALERVLTERERREISEKEESRKVAKENREKQMKLFEKKPKFEKPVSASLANELEQKVDPPQEDHPEELHEPHTAEIDNKADEDLDLEHLEISSDDARQQSIEFVEVKSKRVISQEKKGKDPVSPSSSAPPPSSSSSAVPSRVANPKKSTIEVIPPSDEPAPRHSVSVPPKPAWQAPQATLEVLGVPTTSVTETEDLGSVPSVDESETKEGSLSKAEKYGKKDRKVKERDPPLKSSRRKHEDGTDDLPGDASSRRRVDDSAAKMYLRNTSNSSRPKRSETQGKPQNETEMKPESVPMPSSTSSADEKIESQDSKGSEDQEEQVDAEKVQTFSTRGRGRGREGRGSRRGGLGGRRDVAWVRDDSLKANDSEASQTTTESQSTRPSRGERGSRGRRGGGGMDSGRRSFQGGRGPSIPRERRGPPAQSTNPE